MLQNLWGRDLLATPINSMIKTDLRSVLLWIACQGKKLQNHEGETETQVALIPDNAITLNVFCKYKQRVASTIVEHSNIFKRY